MKNRFSIGEMAKLHNTTIKTLRYYDEIGLLKPIQININNGYRYYSTDIEDFKERKIVRLMEKISSEPELKVSLRQLENMSNRLL